MIRSKEGFPVDFLIQKTNKCFEELVSNDFGSSAGKKVSDLKKYNFPFMRFVYLLDKDQEASGRTDININGIWFRFFAYSSQEDQVNVFLENIDFAMQAIKRNQVLERLTNEFAYKDLLTELPNEKSFMDNLRNEIQQHRLVPNYRIAVGVIDIAKYSKIIHLLRDMQQSQDLIKEVAKRLSIELGQKYFIAKGLGFDTFVFFTKYSFGATDLIAESIQKVFRKSFILQTCEVSLNVHIGISVFPDFASEEDSLLQQANLTVGAAKVAFLEKGHMLYSPKLEEDLEETTSLEQMLNYAVGKEQIQKQFMSFYQPKYDILNNKIVSAESLLRWYSPKGMIPPGVFIPLAEATGLINILFYNNLELSLKQFKQWQRLSNREDLSVAINLSTYQFFQDAQLVKNIQKVIKQQKFNPECLILEITESGAMEEADTTLKILTELKKIGVKISVDDFGTGYSNLGKLKKMPVDELKIDKTLIDDIDNNSSSRDILKATIALAQALGLSLVIEGVETIKQVETIKDLAGDYLEKISLQGYYFAKPLCPEDFMKKIN